MSTTPPNPNLNGAPDREVGVTEARGAVRTGRNIWILAISTGLAVILLLGYVLLHARHMGAISHPQAHDFNTTDISTFNTPAGSARATPGDASATNAQ